MRALLLIYEFSGWLICGAVEFEARLSDFGAFVEVEFLEAQIAQGVETVVDAEFLVGEAVVVVNQRAERLNSLTAAGVDFEAARSSLVEDDGVDAVDFVADFPGGAGCGDLQSSFSQDGVVGQTDAGGFAGGAGGVGADVFAAFQAEAVVDFVGHIPGGGVGHDEFVEDVEVVADSDAEDGGHVVDVEVEADPEGGLGDVGYGF